MAKQLFDGIEYNDAHYQGWREVVDHVAKFFTENGYATKNYFEYVKQDLTDNEAYMVLVPHIVLLHSAPEHGVIKNAFHFMKLKNPVAFQHSCNDPVSIVLSFGCISSQEHLDSIQRLALMLMDDEFIETIFKLETEEELKNYLETYKIVQ